MPTPRKPSAQTPLAALTSVFRAMRKQRGLTQAELAERTGQAQAYVSAIERGSRDVRASTLSLLAAALGCELMLVPKEQAAELRHAMTQRKSAGRPTSILDEVFVPEPEGEGDDL